MFSDLDYYYQLDMNNTDDRNMVSQEDEIKFIIHGYTDRVQFNKTGLILCSYPFIESFRGVFAVLGKTIVFFFANIIF